MPDRPGLCLPSQPNPPTSQAVEFAYSKADARKDGKLDVRFTDVAGVETVLSQLQEVVDMLKNPDRYSGEVKARPPKGILLEGGPGTGKTLMAKAIAGEAGVAFYQMSGAEFIQAIVGVGAARIRDLFRRARVNKPCVIFVDEIDAIGVRRADAGVKTNEEREQTLNQLLTEMDGFTPGSGVIFIAATNRADLLDPALLRAGRFDRKITVNKPDVRGREAVLRVHARKHPIGLDVDFTQVARDTPGLSPADLANLMNEASLEVIRRTAGGRAGPENPETVTQADLYRALDRIQYGVRRDPLPSGTWLRNAYAACEAGKAVVATVLRQLNGRTEAVLKVSIAARGRGSSFTDFARFDDEEYLVQTRGKLADRLRVLCAARAAEEVLFDSPTSYSMPNMAAALRVARGMVTSYNLSGLGVTMYAPPGESRTFRNTSITTAVDNVDTDPFEPTSVPGSFLPQDSTRQK